MLLIAQTDLTAQAAAISATNLVASTPAAGQYRLSWNAKVTTVDGGGSTLGGATGLVIAYTDPDGVAQSITAGALIAAGTVAINSTGNLTTTVLLGIPIMLNSGSAQVISFAFGYTSGGGLMRYNLHLKLETWGYN
jgi:hypothetical protein